MSSELAESAVPATDAAPAIQVPPLPPAPRPDTAGSVRGLLRSPSFNEVVERGLPAGLVALAFLFAIVAQTGLLHRATWLLGDIAYHRGVAYTMQAISPQGEGPIAGLLSYYGGLYPLVLATGSSALGIPIDRLIVIASLVAALLLPATALLVGRRLFSGDDLGVGFFVLIATVAGPLTSAATGLWVESMLPSGTGYTPVFPRDVAILLMLLALWPATSESSIVRVVGTGAVAGATLMFHAQLGLLLCWFLGMLALVRSYRDARFGWLGEAALAVVIALAISSWWWLPRLALAASSGQLLVSDYPGREALRMDVAGFVVAFGVAGILAVLGTALLPVTNWPGRVREVAAAWLLAFLPLIVVNRLLPDIEVISERRIWLVLGIGIVLLAAATAAAIVRRVRSPTMAIALVLTVLVASAPAALASTRIVRNVWQPGTIGIETVDPVAWSRAMTQLNDRVRANHGAIAVTYDDWAVWAWSFSGAQVPSLWLPGYVKLGYDLASTTGTGYLERVRDHGEAFDGGLAGICRLALDSGASALLLERAGDGLATYDENPAAAYRVDPAIRDDVPTDRVVAPGIRYVDANSFDALILEPGAMIQLPWSDPTITEIRITGRRLERGLNPMVDVRDATSAQLVPGSRNTNRGPQLAAVQGVTGGLTIEALVPLEIDRVTGFTPAPDWVPPTDGPVVVDRTAACGA